MVHYHKECHHHHHHPMVPWENWIIAMPSYVHWMIRLLRLTTLVGLREH